MGKARRFSDAANDTVYQSETNSENYAMGSQQNPYNLGSVHFSDQSGIGNFSQAGTDQRKANLKGALFQGNVGFDLQTALLDTGTETIDLNNDSTGTVLSVISTDRFVALDSGTTGTLTTITGPQRPGQRLRLYNTTTNTITITHTAATTVNTIRTPDGSDLTFPGNGVLDLTWDITSAQWRVVGNVGGGGGTSNVPDGTAQFQHLEWNGAAWIAQQALAFGATSGTTGQLNFPNDIVGLSWRNAADTGDIEMKVNTSDFFDLNSTLTMNSNDIRTIDRLQMSGGTTSATSVNDVVWYLNSDGDLVSNINATDGWIWSSGNISKMVLTDSTLEKRNVTAPSFQLYNTIAAQNGTAATISFLANSANTGTGVSMGFIIGDTEDFTVDGRGALKFGVNLDGTPTLFLTMNEGDDEQVDILKETDFNSQDVLNVNRLQMSGGTTSATSVNDVVWYLNSDGDLVSNINATDGWIWSSANITKMFLTDTLLEKRNVTAPSFQLYNTRTEQTGTAGTISILANTANTSTGVAMGFIISDTEVETTDGRGSLRFGVNIDGVPTEFLNLNEGNDEQVNVLADLDMNSNFIQFTERATPSNPAANDGLIYVKDDGGTTTPFFLDSSGVETSMIVAGGSGANTALSNLASVAINTSLLPDADGTLNLGSAANSWLDTFTERLRIETGGASTSTANQIISDTGGMIFNTPAGDRYEFNISGSPNGIAIEEDRIEFLTSGRQHRIDATGDSINILAENTTDSIELWPGTGRTNEALLVQDAVSIFKNSTSGSNYRLMVQYSNATTTGQPAIGQFGFQADDSANNQKAYAGFVAAIEDDTSSSRDGRMQLVVALSQTSGEAFVSDLDGIGMDIQGGGSLKLGFFGVTPVVQQSPAATSAAIITALENLGLFV